MHPIIVVGGGPAGMMSAISAKTHHPQRDVWLLERNDKLGVKMKMTGGGRCNVTANLEKKKLIDYIPKNGKFLYSAFFQFDAQDIIQFFEDNGCPLKQEDHDRMFPITNKAVDIVEALARRLNHLGVKIMFNSYVTHLDATEKYIIVGEQKIYYQHLILATGGKTVPQTGSDGTGYELARSIGHEIVKLIPAEVPLVSNDTFIADKTLQGLSFKDAKVSVYDEKKLIKSITHDLLITHFGLSGPAALRASFYCLELFEMGRKNLTIEIDFLPELSLDTLASSNLEEVFKTCLIPKRLVDYCKTLERPLIESLKKFSVEVYTTRGFASAFVTNGGVQVKEVDPKTFRSKLNPYVSFCGELLDINAYTGGFNITSALSGGFSAGMHVNLDEF